MSSGSFQKINVYTTESGKNPANSAQKKPGKVQPSNKKTLVCLCVSTVLLVIGGICVVSFFSGVFDEPAFFGRYGTKDSSEHLFDRFMGNLSDDEPFDTEFVTISPQDMKNFPMEDAIEFCNAFHGHLPIFETSTEEILFITEMKNLSYLWENMCDGFLLGFKLNRHFRYKSLDNVNLWPSLKDDVAASEARNDSNCVRLQLKASDQNFSVLDNKPCSNITDFDCVVGYKFQKYAKKFGIAEQCLQTVRINGSNPENMFENFQKCMKVSEEEECGLLLFDRERAASMITEFDFPVPEKCWALDVKYYFEYLDVYSHLPAVYNINVSVLHDPEHECLIINRNFEIETTSCIEGGCPLCQK